MTSLTAGLTMGSGGYVPPPHESVAFLWPVISMKYIFKPLKWNKITDTISL